MSVKLQISLVSSAPNFGDTAAEFRALLAGCGTYDLSARAKLTVSGNDRVRWLNGMVTNNIRDLKPGSGVYCFLLNPQGRIQGDLYAYNRGEDLLLDIDGTQTEKITSLLRKHIIMDKVTITDISQQLSALGVSGPDAGRVLTKALGSLPPLQPLQFAEISWQEASITLVQKENPVPSYELWVTPQNVGTLWGALLDAGAKPAGTEAAELLRIACGIPLYGKDIHDRDLPQETGQVRALNFTKGCYIGQEIVERIRSRGNVHRTFSGFRVEGTLPEPGTKILGDDKEVGEITSSASLPMNAGDQAVALGYTRREAAEANVPLHSGAAKLSLASLPFIKF